MKKRPGPRQKLLRPHSMYSMRCYDDAMARVEAIALLRGVERADIVREAIDFFLAHNINNTAKRETVGQTQRQEAA